MNRIEGESGREMEQKACNHSSARIDGELFICNYCDQPCGRRIEAITPPEPKVGEGGRQIFLDCDGVLADFDSYAKKIFGLPPRKAEEKLGAKRFWCDLQSHDGFYRNLPLMPDARELFDAVAHLNPIILTGLPLGDWAEPQKREWGAKHFPSTTMICCMSADKRNHMKPGDILIDDFLKYKSLWVEAGGVFIHHTSARTSLAELRKLGIVGESGLGNEQAMKEFLSVCAEDCDHPYCWSQKDPVKALAQLLTEAGAVPVINGVRIEPKSRPDGYTDAQWDASILNPENARVCDNCEKTRGEHYRRPHSETLACHEVGEETWRYVHPSAQPESERLGFGYETEADGTPVAPQGGEEEPTLTWTQETMRIINSLTPDIQGKPFDPDWFLLRQRFELIELELNKERGGR